MSISVGPGIPTHTPGSLADALHHFTDDATTSGTPVAYLRALRYGTPGDRYTVTAAGQTVTITLAATHNRPNPDRERDSWIELRDTVTTVTATGCDTVTTALPPEIAAATWQRDGATIRARRPRTLRKLRLSALSPLPLLAELLPSSTAASSAAAVSLALAPMPPVVFDNQPPPNTPVTITSGDIGRPEPRHLLDFHTGHERPLIGTTDAAPDTAPPPPPVTPPALVTPPAPGIDAPPAGPPPSPDPSPTQSIDVTTPQPELTGAPELIDPPTAALDPTPAASPTITQKRRTPETPPVAHPPQERAPAPLGRAATGFQVSGWVAATRSAPTPPAHTASAHTAAKSRSSP